MAGGLPTPPGSTPEQVALGKRIFHGEVGGATCAGCHGSDAIGTPVGPDLASGNWLWGDGSLESIKQTIANGVPEPKDHPATVMPPMGRPTSRRLAPTFGRSAISDRSDGELC